MSTDHKTLADEIFDAVNDAIDERTNAVDRTYLGALLNEVLVNVPTVGLNAMADKIFEANKKKGFWDHNRNIGELLMLVTSELGECMEAHRKGRLASMEQMDINIGMGGEWMANFQAHVKDSFEDELADALIRILDMCGGLGIDIQRHVEEKLHYNATRERLHGKNY